MATQKVKRYLPFNTEFFAYVDEKTGLLRMNDRTADVMLHLLEVFEEGLTTVDEVMDQLGLSELIAVYEEWTGNPIPIDLPGFFPRVDRAVLYKLVGSVLLGRPYEGHYNDHQVSVPGGCGTSHLLHPPT